MAQWLPDALLALFSFGLWGLFSKFTVFYIDSKSAFIFQTLGVVLVAFLTLSLINFKPAFNTRGLTFGVLTGLAYGIGCFFYFIAVTKGKITTVVTLTALYPLITILLSAIFLNEPITSKQSLGILCALIAIYLLSS